MIRSDYEGRWVEAFNRSLNEHERRQIQENRLSYPKSTRNAIMEIKERGFDPDSGRLHRWAEAQPEEDAPPKMPGVRGTTLAWDRHHIDALIEHLEGLKAFTPEEMVRRKFGITEKQIQEAVDYAYKRIAKLNGEVTGFYGIFYWGGKLTAVPLDRPIPELPKKPLGMFVTVWNLLATDNSSMKRLSPVMRHVFTEGGLPDLEDMEDDG